MELPPLSRIQGAQANSSLYHLNDGFFFSIRIRQNGNTYFRCSKWRSGCQATAILTSESFQSSVLHNHPPDHLHVSLKLERQRLVNEALNLEHATIGDIFMNTSTLFPDVFTPHSLQPAMVRMRSNALPIKPTTLRDLDAILRDERFKCISATSGFDDSIYAGSVLSDDDCFVIILLSRECKDFTKLAVTLFSFTKPFDMQGSPHQYVAHVIYTVWDDTIIILAWFFMERISEPGFIAAFSYLKHVLERTHFKTILCQHGSLEATAYKSVFLPVTVTFCLQDFVQNVGNFILSEIPNYDSYLIDFACLLCALPILPTDFLHIGLDAIKEEVRSFQGVQAHANILLNHVQSTWIGVFSDFSVSGDHCRTSNVNETVQRKVNQIMNTHSNNIYSLISGIARVAEVSKRDIQDLKNGRKIRQRRGSVSLSNEQEVTMLTQALIHPFGNPMTAAMNLLNVASLRIKHLLNHLR